MPRRRSAYLSGIMAEFNAAKQAWWEAAEYETMLYRTELAEYRELHPMPRLKDFMLLRRAERDEAARQLAQEARLLADLEADWLAWEATLEADAIAEAVAAEELAVAAAPAILAATEPAAAPGNVSTSKSSTPNTSTSNIVAQATLPGATLRHRSLPSKTLDRSKTRVSARVRRRLCPGREQAFPRGRPLVHAPPPTTRARAPTRPRAGAGGPVRPGGDWRRARRRARACARPKTLATPQTTVPARAHATASLGSETLAARPRNRSQRLRRRRAQALPRAGYSYATVHPST